MKKKALGLIVTLVVFTLFGWYLSRHPDVLDPVINTPPIYVIAIGLLKLSILTIRGQLFKGLLIPLDKKLTLGQGFYSSFITTFGNFFLPLQSGAGLRAFYFRNSLGLRITEFISTLSGVFIITFFFYSLVGSISLIIVNSWDNTATAILFIFFLTISFLTFATTIIGYGKVVRMLTPFSKIPHLGFVIKKVSGLLISLERITQSKILLLQLLGLVFIDFVIVTISTFIEFHVLGINVSLVGLTLYLAISSLTVLINITPGAIGIKEGLLIIFSESIGITSKQIIQVAILDRGILFLTLLLTFLFLVIFKRDLIINTLTRDKTS